MINSTSEWLLIARGVAECNYAIHEVYKRCETTQLLKIVTFRSTFVTRTKEMQSV